MAPETILPFFVLMICVAAAPATAFASSRTGDGTIFAPVPIGAGGFIRGASIAPDGTKVVETDAYGAWTFDSRVRDCSLETN